MAAKAAELLKRAKRLLDEEEFEEATIAADAAAELFGSSKDQSGTVDALCVALEARYEEEQYEEVWSRATDQLATFQMAGDKRGASSMCLFIARTEYQENRLEDALATAREALALAQEAADGAREAECHLWLGRFLLASEAHEDATTTANSALELHRKCSDLTGEGEALLLLASIQSVTADSKEALATAKQAVAVSTSTESPRREAATLVQYAGICSRLRAHTEGVEAAREAVRLCQKAGTSRGEAAALSRLVESSITTSSFDSLPELLEERLQSFRDGGDLKSQIQLLQARCDLQLAMQAPISACECAQEASTLAQDGGLLSLSASSLLRLGRARRLAGEFTESSAALKSALDVYRQMDQRGGEGLTILEMSKLHLEEGSFRKALEKAEEAKDIFLELLMKEPAGDAYLASSSAYQKLGKLDQAVEAVLSAKNIFEELRDPSRVASAWLSIATLRYEGNEVEKALTAAHQATTLARSLDGPSRSSVLGDSLRFAISIHLALGDIDSATDVLKEAEALSKRDGSYLEQAQMRLLAAQVYRDRLSAQAEGQKEGTHSKTLKWLFDVTVRKAQGAVKLARSAEDDWTIATTLQTMASVLLMDQGHQDDAESALEEALELVRSLGARAGEVNILSLMGQALLQKGDRAGAKAALTEAESLAKEIGDKESQKTVADLLASFEKAPAAPAAPAAADATQALPNLSDAAAPPPAAAGGEEVFVAPDPEMVKNYIISLVGNMTGSTDDIDSETPLMESGIDSLASVELRTQLQAEFKVNLPSTVMFNYPTIDSLADLLVDECTTKRISWG